MEINTSGALKFLNSIDSQIRSQIKAPPGKAGSGDSVELGGTQSILSKGYVALQSELSDKLASLTGLIGDNSGQQKELSGLFAGADNDEAIRQRAQELLDGYFNVENTGDRIFEFAFSNYTGGDREAFAREFQGYIHKGFAEAEKLLGGLADISVKTREYVDKRVEAFINEGKEDAATAPAGDTASTSTTKVEGSERAQEAANQRAQLLKRAYIPEVGSFRADEHT